jgi:hypothetical protein
MEKRDSLCHWLGDFGPGSLRKLRLSGPSIRGEVFIKAVLITSARAKVTFVLIFQRPILSPRECRGRLIESARLHDSRVSDSSQPRRRKPSLS